MTVRYAILERTPFPGYFVPLARCRKQRAEYDTGLARQWGGYHVQAQPLGKLLTYTEQDARRIVEHRQVAMPRAELMLFGIPAMG